MRDTAGRVAVKLRRPVARWEMRGETVVQKLRPRRLKISRRRGRTEGFLDELRTFHFCLAEERPEHFELRHSAKERQNHRLNRDIGAACR